MKSYEVKFQIKNAGFNVSGTFGGLSAGLIFKSNNIDKSRFLASVDVSTINTGIGLRDKHLLRKESFDVENFKKITVKSTSIAKEGNGYRSI